MSAGPSRRGWALARRDGASNERAQASPPLCTISTSWQGENLTKPPEESWVKGELPLGPWVRCPIMGRPTALHGPPGQRRNPGLAAASHGVVRARPPPERLTCRIRTSLSPGPVIRPRRQSNRLDFAPRNPFLETARRGFRPLVSAGKARYYAAGKGGTLCRGPNPRSHSYKRGA
jgi:hypothetical protein